ncbi:MAG: NAD-dependent epimerase/dehydratase family protein [Defluviitaleaceae bacterium]|nr:NAD-dependent epimerase/dehydratase family protein [Defluviitaleaceae bacterium]
MRVLITGAAGLTGAHLVRECLNSGDTVVGIDNFFRGKYENIKDVIGHDRFEFFECDFIDYIKDPCSDTAFDGIYHLAAIVPTKYFYEEPELTYEVNCRGTHDIFKWAVKHGIKRFVNASSSEIYGHAPDFPTKETTRSVYDSVEDSTRWSYAHGKILTEYLLNHYSSQIDVCHLRYANVYGPYDDDDHHVIPYMINCIANSIPINLSKNYKEARRSFLYMSDCAIATRLAMTHMRTGTSYNIGNPEETTIENLWNICLKAMQDLGIYYNQPLTCNMERAGDPTRRVLDINRARDHLGYIPVVMLEEGIAKTAKWIVGRA